MSFVQSGRVAFLAVTMVGIASIGAALAQQATLPGKVEPKSERKAVKQNTGQKAATSVPKEQPARQTPENSPAPASQSKDLTMPGAVQLALIVQTFMVALSQASLTDNYTVFHSLAAPTFQKDNSPQKLAQLFSGLRQRKIDLTPIILYSPTLVRQPELSVNGSLRLVGYYKSSPQQVHFDLALQPVDGAWRLSGLSVETRAAPAEPTVTR